jgi:hypothetical protein
MGVRAGLALSAVLCAAPGLLAAGPATATAATTPTSASIFTVPSTFSADNAFRYVPAGISSSNDAEDALAAFGPAATLAEERDNLSYDAGQPPPGRRRSYGRSRYRDRMHNSDGSNKIAFMAGAGINIPVANTAKYYTPHVDIGVGAGINFNKTFGILGEFRYDRMGLTNGAFNYQYNNYINLDGAQPSDLAGLDANAHIYSITVDPVVNFQMSHSRVGGYVTGGIGYYHKSTNFTLPQQGGVCDGFGFCQVFIQNQTFDSYSAGGFGANVGVGLSYKLSEFSSERLFIESRYNWMKLASNNNNDQFIFNRRNTEVIPVTVGIRF